ncbi:MAG: hypothetical protein U0797_07225 [Gemmataceae bacterium]
MLRAAEERRALLDRLDVPRDPLARMHAVGFLGEAVDSAGLWATLFHRAGADLLCPFLDSRMLRLALNLPAEVRFRFRRPKDLLKRALARRGAGGAGDAGEARLRPADLRVAGTGRPTRPLVEPRRRPPVPRPRHAGLRVERHDVVPPQLAGLRRLAPAVHRAAPQRPSARRAAGLVPAG